MNKYHLLKNDLDDLIEGYNSNEKISLNQKKLWCRKGKKAAITHEMLGNTHENSLKLLKEDGYDGQPVGSLSGRAAESFWDYNTNHVFPPMKDLIRFGIFMHIDVYRLLHLTLKGEWERFFAHKTKGWRPNVSAELLIDILKHPDEREMKKANQNFNPDTQAIFDLFEHYGKIATHAGYNARQFDTLAQEMVLKELHWLSGESREMKHFALTESTRMKMLRDGSTEEQEAFWISRCVWSARQRELEDMGLKIENRRLKNREIERQWLCIFGDAEIQLFEQKIRLISLERRILLKQADPELKPEDMDRKLAEDEEKLLESLENLKHDAAIAPGLKKAESCGSPLDEDRLTQYRKECRNLIRKIYRLIHPDHLAHHPNYSRLTDRQKEYLKEILQECLEVDTEELGFPKGFVEHETRSLNGLKRVLERIEMILSHAGIEIDPVFEIQGKTLKEQLEWLEKEIQWVEKRISSCKSTLEVLMKDQDILRKQGILDMPNQHAAIREELAKKAEEDRKNADALEEKLKKMFA